MLRVKLRRGRLDIISKICLKSCAERIFRKLHFLPQSLLLGGFYRMQLSVKLLVMLAATAWMMALVARIFRRKIPSWIRQNDSRNVFDAERSIKSAMLMNDFAFFSREFPPFIASRKRDVKVFFFPSRYAFMSDLDAKAADKHTKFKHESLSGVHLPLGEEYDPAAAFEQQIHVRAVILCN